jgi:uncharacterized protein
MNLDDVAQLTFQYGEGWAVSHAQRLLKLIELIGEDLEYDRALLTYAAYLHDWGAFPKFQQPGVEHAIRSRQIAETDILPQTDLTQAQIELVLEAIEKHDYRDQRSVRSNEALLLREADFLEFLGIIGVAREFARGPKDLRQCYKRVQGREAGIRDRLTLPTAKALAEQRLSEMDQFLNVLTEESFGYL